ncbi:hypothetical protein Egran_02363 [Elaphomyces granulatus]|uniref:Uncharacterized protein n=1 Tax=Elaphomyces granulatus TaxID=519963 RepID=A0A232M0I4_9EURO|nr:hypothetical protein Egran_02363 [Elaphomyces granulatus]
MACGDDIKGKLALITGASGGIGAACARRLADLGCSLALTYSSSASAVESLVSELGSLHPAIAISVHQCDMSLPLAIASLFEQIAASHPDTPVSILISNAGYGKRITNIWDISLEEFMYMMNVNLTASFLLVKGVVEGMKAQRWGRIVFVSSIAAYGAGLNGCHYAASKGGLTSMMKNLSTRLAEYNITVNDVAPAMIASTGMLPNADAFPGLKDSIPIGRLGMPADVTNAIEMFIQTGYVTGQSLILAGGLPHQ